MGQARKISLLQAAGGKEPAQVAALCLRQKAGHQQILLITSRDTGRWVLPKGWTMDGKTSAEAAAQEAWEEAGVTGTISPAPYGTYNYDKVLRPGKALPCQVEVYIMKVRKLKSDFPEMHQRRRKWMTVEKAARSVAEPDLRRLLRGL